MCCRALTAKNDGKNDTFNIGELIEDGGCTYVVKIFNRWGKIVYQSDNYQNDWGGYNQEGGITIGSDGALPTGTYYYIVNIVGSGYQPRTGYIYLGTN